MELLQNDAQQIPIYLLEQAFWGLKFGVIMLSAFYLIDFLFPFFWLIISLKQDFAKEKKSTRYKFF